MENRKIPTSALDNVRTEDTNLFMQLWLSSDRAGLVPNGFDSDKLKNLYDDGIIKVTKRYIILNDFLSSNYGKGLKDNYNPHKPVLAAIQNAEFTYDQETHSIIIPEDQLITDFPSSKQALEVESVVTPPKAEPKPNRRAYNQKPTILEIVRTPNFALVLAMLLMIGQTFHTSHSLMSMANLPDPFNTIFAVTSALLMDCLIIYFVANGDKVNSMVFFVFCSLMNIYSYHNGPIEYLSYESFFCFVPALGIPFAVHAVSSKIRNVPKISVRTSPSH